MNICERCSWQIHLPKCGEFGGDGGIRMRNLIDGVSPNKGSLFTGAASSGFIIVQRPIVGGRY